ncbi:HAMP domain-containing sensor histidine kinase [Pseudodesulfovibrio thermohalotolerans]|uniref:HAMP domain-containing sensor histidine kinase n=1 Tax=Pseudodesulfovibrio thermohalotolerans TaxID=2880651 RepID=UPI0024417848|nr:HAMP domain-containing sensor histidine kinase [Pseudodesulfovibrio thermohalotolerans]WFS63097.1 HAMP domain-containing sensor histidine kinase [Pseudodesulfovibrio thermohalotolerans]
MYTPGLRFRFIGIVLLCIIGAITTTAHYMLKDEQTLLVNRARQQAMSLARASAILFTNTFIFEELDMLDENDMVDYISYYVDDVMRTDPRILAFRVLDKHGRTVVKRETGASGGDAYAPPAGPGEDIREIGQGADALLAVTIPLSIESKNWGWCSLTFSMEDIERARISSRNDIITISVTWILFSLLAVGIAVEYLVKSLHSLSDAMERFTVNEDFSKPFPSLPPRGDEIGQLQRSFEWMITRLRNEEQTRARTKEKMFHTEKMATIGQLTASIAHEVNNPLGGVMLCFNNLLKGKLDEQEREQHIEVINSGLSRIRKIMGDLLDYSRQSSMNVQLTDMRDVVRKCVSLLELYSRKRRVEIRVDMPDGLPATPVDNTKIQQVLVNLLVNAVQAMPEGGEIRVEGAMDGEDMVILVSDSGGGIPEAIRDKIFVPFYTTKNEEGTGLGLALSKSLIEQHSGRLELLRSDETGSVFSIRLPRARKDT